MSISNKIQLLKNLLPSLNNRLENCDICPRECRVNRLAGERGYCGTDASLVVYTSFLHHGEEPPISGKNGSGTIFFSGCNLKCIYCQNYKFSHAITGKSLEENELSNTMLDLQNKGAHNINLVTPTHFLPQIVKSLLVAYNKGLHIPIVYNTSGYEKRGIVELLNGIIDIYLTDIKYMSPDLAKSCSNAKDYPTVSLDAAREMSKQVSTEYDNGILRKGLVIRHLVLPNHIDNSKEILSRIKTTLPDALVSVMFQYRPYHNARQYSLIDRPVNYKEYQQIKEFVEELDLPGWVQDFDPPDELAGVYFTPDNEML